jgi:hypothetical protein
MDGLALISPLLGSSAVPAAEDGGWRRESRANMLIDFESSLSLPSIPGVGG